MDEEKNIYEPGGGYELTFFNQWVKNWRPEEVEVSKEMDIDNIEIGIESLHLNSEASPASHSNSTKITKNERQRAEERVASSSSYFNESNSFGCVGSEGARTKTNSLSHRKDSIRTCSVSSCSGHIVMNQLRRSRRIRRHRSRSDHAAYLKTKDRNPKLSKETKDRESQIAKPFGINLFNQDT